METHEKTFHLSNISSLFETARISRFPVRFCVCLWGVVGNPRVGALIQVASAFGIERDIVHEESGDSSVAAACMGLANPDQLHGKGWKRKGVSGYGIRSNLRNNYN